MASQSPFGIFRKHGAILTALLTGLCIFGFILADFLQPEHLPALLAMIAGGCIFWLFGSGTGNGAWYATAGVAVGFVFAMFMPGILNRSSAATTSAGNISEKELARMLDDQQTVNQFMSRVYGLRPERMRNQRDAANFMFGGGQTLTAQRESAVRTFVMAHEADAMGLGVSDAAIRQHLEAAAGGKLKKRDFIAIRQSMGRSEAEIWEMLRYQLKAREYGQLVQPSLAATPGEYWDFYRRFNVTQELDVCEVPVDDFTAGLEPTSEELRAFFDQFKDKFPRGRLDPKLGWVTPVEAMSPQPAFGLLDRVQLAYVAANLDEFTKESAKPTDEEIDSYYDEHREEFPNPRHINWLLKPRPRFGQPASAEKPPGRQAGPAIAEVPNLYAEKTDQSVRNRISFRISNERDMKEVKRAQREVNEAVKEMKAEMVRLASARADSKDQNGEVTITAQEISDQILAFAEERKLKYKILPLLQPQELTNDHRDFALAQETKVDKVTNPLDTSEEPEEEIQVSAIPDSNCVVTKAFMGQAELVYKAQEAVTPGASTRYVYWKVGHEEAREASFDDEGMEEEVAAAWKQNAARPKAKERAEALAGLAAKSPSLSLFESLDKETVSGDEDGAAVLITNVPGVKWMSTSGPFSPPVLSTIRQIPKAGENFMRAIAEEMAVNEVRAVPNADESIYYVIKLVERNDPQALPNKGNLKEQFLSSRSPSSQQNFDFQQMASRMTTDNIAQGEQVGTYQRWYKEFDEKHQIKVLPPPQPR